MTGTFLAFEGIDGCGKSTQLRLFDAWARERGLDPLVVREPGGTALGEQVRRLLLDHASGDLAPAAEALLYAASRAELVAKVVLPALAGGRLVVADRFVASSLAYQGAGRGLGFDMVAAVNELATGGLRPARTVLLRIDPERAAARRGSAADRIETAGGAFFATVAAAYDELVAADPDSFVVVDASRSEHEVHAAVVAALEQLVTVPA